MSAESGKSLSPQRLADFSIPRDCRISPCGSFVVYALRPVWTKTKDRIVSSLWLADVGRENSARQLTQGNFNDTSPVFSPDSKSIAFLSDRGRPGGRAAIYLLPIDGGEALPVTCLDLEKGVSSFQFSPDGKNIAYMSEDETSEEQKNKTQSKDDANVYGEGWVFNRLRMINLDSRNVSTLVARDAQIRDFAWSPDGNKLAFTEQASPTLDDLVRGSTIRIFNREDVSTTTVCHYKSLVTNLIWHEDDRIMWTGKIHEESLITSTGVCGVAAQEGSQWQRIGLGTDECVFETRACGKEVVAFVQKGLSDELQTLKETLYSEQIDFSMINRGWDAVVQDERKVYAIIKGSSEGTPNVFSVVGGKCVKLSNHNEDIDRLELGQDEVISLSTLEDFPLDGVLCTPRSLAGRKGPHPTVVVLRGGPYGRVTVGSDPGLNWALWLLALGYVVLLPNYRGGSSHGQKYAESCGGKADASYQDVIALTKKCIEDGIIDEKRVAIAGWSQGGYLSYLAATRDETFHFAAAICGAGVTDWNSMTMSSDLPLFQSQLAGRAPWDSDESDIVETRAASPMYHIQKVNAPCLILHGEEDTRVPKEQAIGFHRGMRAKGKECELVLYPREGHGWPAPFESAHYTHMLSKMETFLKKHLS